MSYIEHYMPFPTIFSYPAFAVYTYCYVHASFCNVKAYTGYKNMPDIRTLYGTPDDVLITGIHCNVRTRISSII